MRYFSMFSGVGGFENGIQKIQRNRSSRPPHRGGEESLLPGAESLSSPQEPPYTCVGVSEIDKFACKVLRKQFPEVQNYGDATKINTERLPNFDLLVGGFPCQAFSIAGGRKGFEDTRGTLFREIARIARDKRPKYLLLENVKGLVNHEKGKTLAVILSTFQELGYSLEWGVCNSRYFGVPQNRERIFIIGRLRGGEGGRKVFPQLGTNKEDTRTNQEQYYISNASPRESKWQPHSPCLQARDYKDPKVVSVGTLSKNKGEGNKIRVADFRNDEGLRIRKESISPTLSTRKHSETDVSTMPHFVSEDFRTSRIRRLTPRECERLQGFPDDWTRYGLEEDGTEVEISDTQRYKMMGNAVTTNVVQAIVEKMLVQNNE